MKLHIAREPYEWKCRVNYSEVENFKFDYYIAYDTSVNLIKGYFIVPHESNNEPLPDEFESVYKQNDNVFEVLHDRIHNRKPSLDEIRRNNLNELPNTRFIQHNKFYLNRHSNFLDLIAIMANDSLRLPVYELLKEYLNNSGKQFWELGWEISAATLGRKNVIISYVHSYHIRKYDIQEYYEGAISLDKFEFIQFKLVDTAKEYTW